LQTQLANSSLSNIKNIIGKIYGFQIEYNTSNTLVIQHFSSIINQISKPQ
jgi:hypothetical protein